MKLFTVGSVALELGCSSEAIRMYERNGVIKPIRDSQGRRLLTEEDIQKITDHRSKKRVAHANKSF